MLIVGGGDYEGLLFTTQVTSDPVGADFVWGVFKPGQQPALC